MHLTCSFTRGSLIHNFCFLKAQNPSLTLPKVFFSSSPTWIDYRWLIHSVTEIPTPLTSRQLIAKQRNSDLGNLIKKRSAEYTKREYSWLRSSLYIVHKGRLMDCRKMVVYRILVKNPLWKDLLERSRRLEDLSKNIRKIGGQNVNVIELDQGRVQWWVLVFVYLWLINVRKLVFCRDMWRLFSYETFIIKPTCSRCVTDMYTI
jgi:hypothetical protein